MKQKKPFKTLFFFVSFLLSIFSLIFHFLLLRSRKKYVAAVNPLNEWKGLWVGDNNRIILEIDDDSAISIDNNPLQLVLRDVSEDKLEFQDTYGYRIAIKKTTDHLFRLYDEAEGKDYAFTRIGK